jgi:hypothetical protein
LIQIVPGKPYHHFREKTGNLRIKTSFNLGHLKAANFSPYIITAKVQEIIDFKLG